MLLPNVVNYSPGKNEPTLEIIIQISNYQLVDCGISNSISFGEIKDIQKIDKKDVIITSFLFGNAFLIGLYHIGLFLQRRKEKSYLFFGFICLAIAIQAAATGGRLLYHLLNGIDWDILFKFDIITGYLAMPFFLLFIDQIFKKCSLKIINRFMIAIVLLLSLIVFSTPVSIFSYTIKVYEVIIIFFLIYVILIPTKAIVKKVDGSILFIAGFFIFMLTMVNDLLNENSIIDTAVLIPFGITSLILFQSIILSRQYAKAFNTIEIISKDLNIKNTELIRVNKLKDEFLTNTSHELKSPLLGIVGLADVTARDLSKFNANEIRQNMSLIVTSGRRLSNMINDILDFSRLKHNDIKMQFALVDIKSTVDAIVAILQKMAKDKEVELKNYIEPTIPLVMADEARLQQILINLVNNAIKFTHTGSISISAKEYFSDTTQKQIQITVSDTGIGIPADKHEIIFNSFEQIDESIAREYGGTGIGLSIVKRLVDLHKGKIWVESAVGSGSHFHFTLPVSSSHNKALVRPAEISYSPAEVNFQVHEKIVNYTRQSDKRKILIVDDDLISQRVLSNYLDNDEYLIVAVSDGNKALDIISAKNFDLILLDFMMPKISGIEVCQKIRENYGLHELPVIMLTIRDNLSDIISGFNSGVNDYLIKPVKKEELISRINTLISLKKAFEEIKVLKNDIELIVENIPEGILSINSELIINYANNRFNELFRIQGTIEGKSVSDIFDKEVYNNIRIFKKHKKDKYKFEWITGNPEKPVLVEFIIKVISPEFTLLAVSEIKDVLAEKELETCYYIIRGFSERETAKLLYKGRTTINSNKVRAKEKLKENNLVTLLKKLN